MIALYAARFTLGKSVDVTIETFTPRLSRNGSMLLYPQGRLFSMMRTL